MFHEEQGGTVGQAAGGSCAPGEACGSFACKMFRVVHDSGRGETRTHLGEDAVKHLLVLLQLQQLALQALQV